jgi:hypothetical protein
MVKGGEKVWKTEVGFQLKDGLKCVVGRSWGAPLFSFAEELPPLLVWSLLLVELGVAAAFLDCLD